MKRGRPINRKAYGRAWVAVALIVVCSLLAFTGFLLWLVHSGSRSGRRLLLLGRTRSQ